ncbi:MAG TPA: HEAT repeat domain-containing protein [Patescibacteria group bacterium]|nr:HEAT repeat domain-containing protein [Patescibacteria group bacterium]
MKKRLLLLLTFTCLLVISGIFYSLFIIQKDVKAACLKAKTFYQKGCVESLIQAVQSDDYSYREKNTAVWALGQIADKKALPFLTELASSLPEQERCHYDEFICAYEVQKAIKWCTQGNVTNWMYRNREQWK